LLRGLFIKLFFYSFIYSLNHSFSLTAGAHSRSAKFAFALRKRSYYTNSREATVPAYSKVSCFLASPALFIKRCVTPDMLVNQSNHVSIESLLAVKKALPRCQSLTFPFKSTLPSDSKLSFNSITFQSLPFQSNFVNSFYFTFYYVYFIGILIFFISIAVSFIGYTLVFGNLSYYGIIVILGLVSSFPSLIFLILQFLSFLLLFVASVLLLIFFFL
jgi:hypothetical protein